MCPGETIPSSEFPRTILVSRSVTQELSRADPLRVSGERFLSTKRIKNEAASNIKKANEYHQTTIHPLFLRDCIVSVFFIILQPHHVMENIRNFCIIAHIDHGKSTLADRLLEATGTIEQRRMKSQYLDQLELERERGITIKMAPVRMSYSVNAQPYTFNLIDTPGHPDFGYEVSRALAAVEGAILLVDGTQGVQAQTLSNLHAAQKAGLTIIGAVNKVDLSMQDIEGVIDEVALLINQPRERVHRLSGKTGEGVDGLLRDIAATVPPPRKEVDRMRIDSADVSRALIFDSFYDDHRGIVAAVRMFDGSLKEGDVVFFAAVGEKIKIKEVGVFAPTMSKSNALDEGNIGYIVTGLKDPHKIKIGDTVLGERWKSQGRTLNDVVLPGYREPNPVVFVSFFPDDPDEFENLKKALERLKLNDSSFSFEPDFNEVLGRGFKGGFLGKLHFEIVSQRLEREFNIATVTSFPSVAYRVRVARSYAGPHALDEEGYVTIHNPKDLPEEFDEILEPMIRVEIVSPASLLGSIMGLQESFRWQELTTESLGDRVLVHVRMPLSELISDFDDRLKSVSGGFASFSYEDDGWQRGDLVRLDIWVANEQVPGLSRIVPRQELERSARSLAIRLKEVLPRQQFTQAIQARAIGRVIARETIPALRKDVTGYLYGGDRTRKMKLWKKQQKGKKKLLTMARVRINPTDFKKLLSK